jgi:hypothetical protein
LQTVGEIDSVTILQSTDKEKSYRYFKQDNATAYTTNNSVVALDKAFGTQVIS